MLVILLVILSVSSIVRSKNLTICFNTYAINVRGTTIAIYDYAHYNELLLENKSIFVLPNIDDVTKGAALDKFTSRFTQDNIHLYDSKKQFDLPDKAKSVGCDVLYMIKAGGFDSVPTLSSQIACDGPPVAVHAVFFWQKHGASYAMISQGQAQQRALRKMQTRQDANWTTEFILDSWVPHIIEPAVKAGAGVQTRDYRKEKSIPDDSIVLCRHGSSDSFNVPFVQEAVCSAAERHGSLLHFLFLGTNNWTCTSMYPHNIHFLPATADVREKEAYFKACGAMLHARNEGEQFSVALGEASVRNLPILFRPSTDNPPQPLEVHKKAFLYTNETDLLDIIASWVKGGLPKGDFNAYKEFTPVHVMARFDRILIQRALEARKKMSLQVKIKGAKKNSNRLCTPR